MARQGVWGRLRTGAPGVNGSGNDIPFCVYVPVMSLPVQSPLYEAFMDGIPNSTEPKAERFTDTGICFAPWSGTSRVAVLSPM